MEVLKKRKDLKENGLRKGACINFKKKNYNVKFTFHFFLLRFLGKKVGYLFFFVFKECCIKYLYYMLVEYYYIITSDNGITLINYTCEHGFLFRSAIRKA